MKRLILTVSALIAGYTSMIAAPDEIASPKTSAIGLNLMEGKHKTERTIFLERTLDAMPGEAFRLWTSEEGIRKFFAPAARVEARVGGRYEIIFAPAKDPEGESHGTKGARILKFVPERELAFEWITFAGDELLGYNAPPYAPAAERNVRPLPTWVELTFAPVAGKPGQTHLRFAHYGFGEGEKWEKSFHWFTRAWKGVLDELADYCQNRKSTAAHP
jgi:uncharacterized protein YndB with AHSA1/START domain